MDPRAHPFGGNEVLFENGVDVFDERFAVVYEASLLDFRD